MQIPFSFRVKNGGTTDRPEEIFQVVGLEGEPKIDEFIRGSAPTLQVIATALREKAEGTGEGTRQANDPGRTLVRAHARQMTLVGHFRNPGRTCDISELADMCCNVFLLVKDNSGYKDLITAFVRLGLGEMLAAVMRQVDAAYIGISEGMFDVGEGIVRTRDKLVSRARDKLVHQSKSAQGKSRGGTANKRPDYK
jgi:hypothetical protein